MVKKIVFHLLFVSTSVAQMPSHVERPPKTITSPDVPAVSEDAKPVQPKVPEDFMSQDAVPGNSSCYMVNLNDLIHISGKIVCIFLFIIFFS